MAGPTPLRRTLGLPLLTLYGLGTMVGGGFYALTGKVAGTAGMYTPAAFLVALLVAGVSALSFGELSRRFPTSAGEARYVLEAFGSRRLAQVVGWLVILTGVVSAATLCVAFGLFLGELTGLPLALGAVGVAVALGAIAAWGIGESVVIASVITVIEVGGLLYVGGASAEHLATLPTRWLELVPTADATGGVLLGSVLAFYAFVGFEDLVNLAEEVRDVRTTLPRAIVWSLVASALLYLVVSTAAVLAVPPDELAAAASPLARLVGEHTTAAVVVTLIGMLAGVNGALMQVVMASRVAYGMARRGLAPSVLGRVHEVTQTPLFATGVVTAVVCGLALVFPLESLARVTSVVLLAVFGLVNASLVRIRQRESGLAVGAALGVVLCGSLLVTQLAALAGWLDA